jgi:hypothetical protein
LGNITKHICIISLVITSSLVRGRRSGKLSTLITNETNPFFDPCSFQKVPLGTKANSKVQLKWASLPLREKIN